MKPKKLPRISKWKIFGAHHMLLSLKAKLYREQYVYILQSKAETFTAKEHLLLAEITEPLTAEIKMLTERLNRIEDSEDNMQASPRSKMHAIEINKSISNLKAEIDKISKLFEKREELINKYQTECELKLKATIERIEAKQGVTK